MLMLLVTPLSLMAATQSNSSHRFFEGDILLPPSLAGDYDVLGKPSNRKSPEFSGIFPKRGGESKEGHFPDFFKTAFRMG